MKTDIGFKILASIMATVCIWLSGALFMTLNHATGVLPTFILLSGAGVSWIVYLVIVNYKEKK
jgi:hypothetical protein